MERLPELVECPRLMLRRWQVDDVPQLNAAVTASLEHLRPWMPWIAFEPLSEDDRRNLVIGWDESWAKGEDAVYGVFADGEVVGGCGLHRRIGPGAVEIGYWIHVDHTRQGYATELADGLTTAAFAVPGISRVEIHHDQANAPSGGIPQALGFERDGEFPDDPQAPGDVGIEVRWSMTAAAWSVRSRSAAQR